MRFEIRRAAPAEAGRLTDLARAAKAHWEYSPAWLAAWDDELVITPDYVAVHRVFVAESDGGLIGVCVLEDRGDHWALEHVWVDPANHGRGVGATIVRYALGAARACRAAAVRVVSDPNAAGFYERLGARLVGAMPAPMAGAPSRELPVYQFDLDTS